MKEDQYLVALSSFVSFGPVRIGLLYQYFESYKNAWKADRATLLKLGLSEKTVNSFIDYRSKFDIESYFARLECFDINAITIHSNQYPENLKKVKFAPMVLYVKGSLNSADSRAIAIVGTRKMSSYGRDVASSFANALASAGVTIISGLAYGIDAEAHKGALNAGGRTIAVLGGGLDKIYPSANAALAKKIVENGALVSEYPLGYPALPVNFAMRNRIISGLSKGVVVVEGKRNSGTLLTVSHAAEQSVEVYAVPGPIYSPLSEAPHDLIRKGAKLASTPEDILEDLEITAIAKTSLPQTHKESVILGILESEPMHIDEVVRMYGGKTCDITSQLTMMELRGLVKNIGGGIYKKL